MSLHPVLSMVHASGAVLLISLALLSVLLAVLIAVKPATDQTHTGLMKKANTVGSIEHAMLGFVALTGVIAVFTGSWSFSQLWVMMGVIIVTVYSGALIFLTKPSRLVVMKGGSALKVGMQVTLHIGHLLLLIVAFTYMLLKPMH